MRKSRCSILLLWTSLVAASFGTGAPLAAAKSGKKVNFYWIRPQGEVGYEWYTVSGDGEDVKVSGLHFALPVVVDFVFLPHVLHGYGLAGLGFGFASGKTGLDVATVNFKFNPVFLQLGTGVSYELAMLTKGLNVEGALKYDLGFTGNAEAKSSFGTTGYDIIQYSRFHFALPSVRYEIDKHMTGGAGLSFYSGTLQLKDLNEGETRKPLSQKGTELSFFFGYTL